MSKNTSKDFSPLQKILTVPMPIQFMGHVQNYCGHDKLCS